MLNSFRLCGTLGLFTVDCGLFVLEAECLSAAGSLLRRRGSFLCRYEGNSVSKVARLMVPGVAVLVSGRLAAEGKLSVLAVDKVGLLSSGEVPPGGGENSVMVEGFVTRSADEGALGLSLPADGAGGMLDLDVVFPGMSRAEALLASKYVAKGHSVRVAGKLAFAGDRGRDIVIEAGSVDYSPCGAGGM